MCEVKRTEELLDAATKSVYDRWMVEMVQTFWTAEKTKEFLFSFLSGMTVRDGSGRWNIVRAIAEAVLPEDDADAKRFRELRESRIKWVTNQTTPVMAMY